MTATRSKKSGRARRPAVVYYVYCVGKAAELTPAFANGIPESIEPDADATLIASADLAAAASAVPRSVYGETAFPGNLQDPAWTAVHALRHERVVEHLAGNCTIIPLRFGTVYFDEERVRAMLARKRARLRRILVRLKGMVEWGVDIYIDAARWRERVDSASPRLRAIHAGVQKAAPGRSYLMGKQLSSLRAGEARTESERLTAEIERQLGRVSEESTRLRRIPKTVSERGELAARMAFLVRRAGFSAFRASAERIARDHASDGFSLELTGPWPPYNFSDDPAARSSGLRSEER